MLFYIKCKFNLYVYSVTAFAEKFIDGSNTDRLKRKEENRRQELMLKKSLEFDCIKFYSSFYHNYHGD
ncbi:hypothetical protein KM790_07445 [Clostridium tyrobutyricum]|nr:hypothetical protein [Clostridium tyrobutyricum]